MIPSIIWTEPALCHYDYDLRKAWFVYFDVTNEATGEKRRIQKRGGINYWKSLEDRVKAGNSLRESLKTMLENGWSPFEEIKEALVYPMTPLNQALDFALSKCKVAHKTQSGYRGTVTFAKAAADKLRLSQFPIKDIDQQHVMLLMEKMTTMRRWSNKAYNKNLGYLCAIIGRLKEWKVIKFNPAEGIKTLPVAETRKYVPYTAEEKKKIQEHLYLHHYRYFAYLMVIYHTGMRPKEVLALQVKDVDLERQTITIHPDLDRENSKVKKIRYIPINAHLMPFFREMQLEQYDRSFYVFGSPFASGRGNQGTSKGGVRGTKHPDYFKPAATMIKRDTVTRKWKAVVKDGLGIDKYQYAMKHTGTDDKILAGIDLDALKELYGHSSKFMTEKYASVVKEVHKQKIIELSPSF